MKMEKKARTFRMFHKGGNIELVLARWVRRGRTCSGSEENGERAGSHPDATAGAETSWENSGDETRGIREIIADFVSFLKNLSFIISSVENSGRLLE